ncbi:MAG TPA: hydroxymethylglutaryl-CoA lyase [Terriglobia bacterium]|nr:hydroxymethylglutaryl-CoA lyase [Terriglobia bacterium]
MEKIKIIECPRDAWQRLEKIIPAEAKADYLGKLLAAGFQHLDAVSFVAPQHVPQMADSEAVMARLLDAGLVRGHSNGKSSSEAHHLEAAAEKTSPEMIAIIVDEEGLARALKTPGVSTLGYPYSISANFRRQNANLSLGESRALVEKIQRAAEKSGKSLVVSIAMAFGNPFNEPWAPEIVMDAIDWLKGLGVTAGSLADTAGAANAKAVGELVSAVQDVAQGIELGVHLHSRPEEAEEKVLAAYEAGCWRFDSALTGLGDCPFAADELVGNIPTETVVSTLAARGLQTGIDPANLEGVVAATKELRRAYLS